VATTDRVIAEDAIRVLDHGFVRLEDSMANDLSVARSTVVGWLSGVPASGQFWAHGAICSSLWSGRCRSRTCDLLRVKQALSQLS
jgi:hypothetical protein